MLATLRLVLRGASRTHSLACGTSLPDRTQRCDPSAPPRCGASAVTYPSDIYSEPEHDDDTLANLGPLRGLAGVWEGRHGLDVPPKPLAPERQEYVERI